MRSALGAWRTALFTSLGLASLGCGGSAVEGIEGMGGAGGNGGTVSTGGVAGASAPRCENPVPYTVRSPAEPAGAADPIPGDSGTGFVSCDGGLMHRPTVGRCPSYLPRENGSLEPRLGIPGTSYACLRDADCTERPLGTCHALEPWGGSACTYGCVEDSDCGSGSICACGDPVGQCVSSNCKTDADCGAGLCARTLVYVCEGTQYFACTTPTDECRSSEHCDPSEQCTLDGSVRRCTQRPACGRPFIVNGEARLAAAEPGDGWSRRISSVPGSLDCDLRAALSKHWAELGLMEHASVAAFARFTLDLMSLGAPAALLHDAQRAQGDEIAHAELCFALASSYAGHRVSPGALSLSGALNTRSRFEIGRTAFLEACIGETLAAVEARLTLEQTRDEAARRALARIAEDEARHAELGWRFIQWLLETSAPEAAEELRECLGKTARGEAKLAVAGAGSEDERLAQHGMTSEAVRERARELAFSELILPLTEALLARSNALAA